jgi:hypothetical protein
MSRDTRSGSATYVVEVPAGFRGRTDSKVASTDGPMGYPWPPRPYPQACCLCESYLMDSRWDLPTEHVAWADHPLSKV